METIDERNVYMPLVLTPQQQEVFRGVKGQRTE